MSPTSDSWRVLRAFAYLRAASFDNALRLQLRRLREPKYLLGAVVMGAYLTMMLGGPLLHPGRNPAASMLGSLPLAQIGSVLLLVIVLAAWVLPGNRAAMAFSEAEAAFLFPAPLSRVALVNFSLLRSQLRIFVSAFVLSVLFGRGRGLPGNAWQHAVGLWLVFATLRLHFLGASFAHERLFEMGWQPWLRRTVGAVLALLLLVALVGWIAGHVPPPRAEALAGAGGLARWIAASLATPPLPTVLAPFRWLVAPLLGGGGRSWGLTLPPALGLLALHYLWVVRSHVSFEEASIDLARRRAQRVQAMRDGRWRLGQRASTARPPPFALSPRGTPPVAFLWEGLIAAGAAGRPRNAIAVVAVAGAILLMLARTPLSPVLAVLGGVAFGLACTTPMMGLVFAQRGLRGTLDRLDLYKAMPVPGWQVALGTLLAATTLIIGAQWAMLFLSGLATLTAGHGTMHAGAVEWTGLAGLLLLSPPLTMLVLCLPLAGVLWFPAWAGSIGTRSGGFEAAGQRMLFAVSFMLALLVLLAPVGLVGGGLFLLGKLLVGNATGMLVGGVAVAALLAVEVALIVRWLGGRIDRFDLSKESR